MKIDLKPDPENKADLKRILDRLVLEYGAECLSSDPLELVRQYSDPRDQETAGLIAALFSLGQVDLIREAIRSILERCGNSPYQFAIQYNPVRDGNPFSGFVYRFYRDRDVGILLFWIGQMLRETGSIRSFFLKGYRDDEPHVGPAISRFVRSIADLKTEPFYTKPCPYRGAFHFLTDPDTGGACKRLNLYLRWMVRGDLDLGLWKEIPASKLVIPLDTHIMRLARRLGLTRRSTACWRTALEITESLKTLDPDDPVRYDFALCSLGKQMACPRTPDRQDCSPCPLQPVCRFEMPSGSDSQTIRTRIEDVK